ncbi:hypothetical protein MMC13_001334 [Lambiella insularis]|nr:hypothetical protein [Lambiella insularis]
MATFDVHFEAPAHRTAIDRRKDDARFIFNQTIAGHYRNGRTGYTRVGVLLITWERDDMNLKVDKLQAIFRDKFSFETVPFQIPSANSDTALLEKVSHFVHEYNSPDNLMIVYYGGHGYKGTETEQFKLAAFVRARSLSKSDICLHCCSKIEGDGEGDPKAFFNDTFNCLRLPHTDILLIIDCCYAACAFDTQGLGKRKYELMASAPPDKLVPSAKHKDSFTSRLCQVLEGILSESRFSKGFATSELYRRIYHKTKDDIKPSLFDQSSFDYGKIWLRPLKTYVQPDGPLKSQVTIDLTLRMAEMPNPANINELARALQYIPHVDEIKFEKLHAPAEEIQEFFYGMKKAMYTKKIIQKIRLRLQKKADAQELKQATHSQARRPSLRVNVASHHDHTPSWRNAEAILRDGSKLPVSMTTGKVAPRSPSLEASFPVERPSRFDFWDLFSVAWSFDFDSTRHVVSKVPALSNKLFTSVTGETAQSPDDKNQGRQKYSLPSVVYAAILDNEKRTQTLDMFMWMSIVLGICVIFHAS